MYHAAEYELATRYYRHAQSAPARCRRADFTYIHEELADASFQYDASRRCAVAGRRRPHIVEARRQQPLRFGVMDSFPSTQGHYTPTFIILTSIEKSADIG